MTAKNGEEAKDAHAVRMQRRIHYKLRADGEKKGEIHEFGFPQYISPEKEDELYEEHWEWTEWRERKNEKREEKFCDELGNAC